MSRKNAKAEKDAEKAEQASTTPEPVSEEKPRKSSLGDTFYSLWTRVSQATGLNTNKSEESRRLLDDDSDDESPKSKK